MHYFLERNWIPLCAQENQDKVVKQDCNSNINLYIMVQGWECIHLSLTGVYTVTIPVDFFMRTTEG